MLYFAALTVGVVMAFLALCAGIVVTIIVAGQGTSAQRGIDKLAFSIMWMLIAVLAITAIAIGADRHQAVVAFCFCLAMLGIGAVLHYIGREPAEETK